jgi:hypothetical protein
MSDMLQKLEPGKTDKSSTNAKCNYNWFLENLIAAKMRVTKQEMNKPSEIEIDRAMTKRTELWVKLHDLKGGDMMFEKKGEWPTND